MIEDLESSIFNKSANKNYILWAFLISKNITTGSLLHRLMSNGLFEMSLYSHAVMRCSVRAFALSVTCTASLSNLVQSAYF